jgi:hypothetical protein
MWSESIPMQVETPQKLVKIANVSKRQHHPRSLTMAEFQAFVWAPRRTIPHDRYLLSVCFGHSDQRVSCTAMDGHQLVRQESCELNGELFAKMSATQRPIYSRKPMPVDPENVEAV